MANRLFILSLGVLSIFSDASNPFAAIGTVFNRGARQTFLEQDVEDINSLHKFDNFLVRRLIVMPLTEAFNPNQINAMHGKVQFGDKCSLPSSLGKIIFDKPYEVPWLFEVKPVNKTKYEVSKLSYVYGSDVTRVTEEGDVIAPSIPTRILDKAYISPLDFRSPENYIFLPQWLMKCLGLQPNDLVDISFVRIKLASLVVLQPLTLTWDALIEAHGDPKSLLEHEINKYSSITSGSTIAIEIKGVEYPIYVKQVLAEGGVSVKGVRVQDADVKVDIDRGYLHELIKYQKIMHEKAVAANEAEDKLTGATATTTTTTTSNKATSSSSEQGSKKKRKKT